MSDCEVLIAGGGLAGSLAAAMLGRRGCAVTLVDPHDTYPPDFRCEKLDGSQVRILERTGLAAPILRAATYDRECWVAQRGRLIEKRRGDQHGIRYDTLVNAARALIPPTVTIVKGKVGDVVTRDDEQTATLADGRTLTARLVIVANGLNVGLRHRLGMQREELSPCHSVMLGFDLKPKGCDVLPFPAMTYYGERLADRIAYITMFPIGSLMRANFSVYRSMDDPWLRRFREAPRETLCAALPGLRRYLGDFDVPSFVQIRPADLYVTRGVRRAGVVLIGDAYSTSCPGAGTGTTKVFTDIERLGNEHIPRWLATPGMGAEKIAAFYDDPAKVACERACLDKAFRLRSLSVDPSLRWEMQRRARFAARLAIGAARAVRSRLVGRSAAEPAVGRPGAANA